MGKIASEIEKEARLDCGHRSRRQNRKLFHFHPEVGSEKLWMHNDQASAAVQDFVSVDWKIHENRIEVMDLLGMDDG